LPKYSVCMTCFNEAPTVMQSLRSLLTQLDSNFEVVIVDNFSTDGTYDILQDFQRGYGVRVIQRRCSRGIGRQVAFEYASGDYVIANMDLDDLFLPVLNQIISRYHDKAEGKMLAIFNSKPPPNMTSDWVQNITIAPRQLVAAIGGWRDLNVFEDWDIWNRANKEHLYGWTSFKFAKNATVHPEPRNPIDKLRERYGRYRYRLKLRRKMFSPGEKTSISQKLPYWAATLSLLFGGKLEGQDPAFDSLNLDVFVDLQEGNPC